MAKKDLLFGKRIKEFRLVRGRSQSWLAAKLNVSLATIVRWEKGQVAPSDIARTRAERIIEETLQAA